MPDWLAFRAIRDDTETQNNVRSTPLAASFFMSHMENTNGRHHRHTDSHNLTILNAFCRTRWHLRVIYVASSAVSRFTIRMRDFFSFVCFVSILRNNKGCCSCVGAAKKLKTNLYDAHAMRVVEMSCVSMHKGSASCHFCGKCHCECLFYAPNERSQPLCVDCGSENASCESLPCFRVPKCL